MKLHECKDWKAVHFDGRTILRKDCLYMSGMQVKELWGTEVEPMKAKGHYKAVKKEEK